MDPIHIARERKTLGKFTPEEVAEGLSTGRFKPTDLAWRDPMPAWVPLGEFEGLPDLPPTGPPPAAPPPPLRPAWERWREIGVPAAAAETITEILAKPAEVFRCLPANAEWKRPFAFFLLTGVITGWVALGYQYAAFKMNPAGMEDFFQALEIGNPDTLFLLSALSNPVSVPLAGVLMGLCVHGALRLLWRPRLEFAAVFRVFAYAWGAASAAQLVPVCGGLLYPILGMALTTVGLRAALGVGPLASALAAAFPMLLCLGGIAAAQSLAV